LAVTETVEVLPALTTTLAACACEPTSAVMVQPSGPVAVALNGRSSGVSLVSVRLKLNDASLAPLSCGVSVVSVTSPAALGETRTSTASVADAPEAVVPLTSIRWVPAVAAAGTVTLSVILVAVEPSDWMPSIVNPPPRRTAVHPVGTAPTASVTRPGWAVVTERSKLGFEPGATAMAGNGVVSVIADAALAAGAPASIASPRIEVTSPTLAERDRTSETLDTTDTGHLLMCFPLDRGRASSRARTARSLTPAGCRINQASVKRPQYRVPGPSVV